MTTLFHYCSTSTFVSIISTRTIWLSSLNLSNDTMEGKLVAETINRLASLDNLGTEIVKDIQQSIAISEKTFHGLGFCLSEEGDLLSQWRGYATDATGFSIGFSKKYLQSLSENRMNAGKQCKLQKVLYDTAAQEELIRPTYNEVKKIVDSGHLIQPTVGGVRSIHVDYSTKVNVFIQAHTSVYLNLFALSSSLYSLKTSAFCKEMEWRLVSFADDSCDYKPMNDRVVPYKIYDLDKLENESVIEVIIGPKNLTPPEVVESLLRKHGFNDVKIVRSSATYR